MDSESLISALEETVSYLRTSKPSDWSSMPVEEIIRKLNSAILNAKNAKPVDVVTLDRLFAPTGVIQEISIDNGWGTKFLRISQTVDEFIGGE